MKPTLSVTINREGARIHRIIDDTHYTTRNRKPEIRRDPMVEALFGVATASKQTSERARLIRDVPSTSTR